MNTTNETLQATEGINNGSASQSANISEKAKAVMQQISNAASQPTAEDVEYQKMRASSLITLGKDYPQKEFLLMMNGIMTISLGDIHMIQAQAKQGKSTVIKIFTAAMLAGKWGNIESALAVIPKIVIFDTEQFESDTFRQYQLMMSMGGMEKEDHNKLSIFNLRSMSYDERVTFVTQTIMREKPQVAVIDGIRDLVPDINDPVACPAFVQDMMQLASKVNCAIIGVLHNNPGEGKARGWLGTEWINKCGYSFEPQKENNIVTVKNTIYRGAPVADWQFTFANDGSPVCDEYLIQRAQREAEEQKQKVSEEAKAKKDKEHLDIVISVLKAHNNEYSRAELVTVIDEMDIAGFKRRTIYKFIEVELTLADPPFLEINGRMCVAENYVQADIPFTD